MSDERKDGGPAFPTTKPLDGWGDPNRGMSLRDYFAAAALTGFVAGHLCTKDAEAAHGEGVATFAASAYELADAMLKAREK